MLKDIKLLYLKLCTPISLLHIVKVMIFYIPHGKNPTQEEIDIVLKYYEKYKDEIDEEIPGTRYDKFRKGRVTYLINSQKHILYG